MIDHLLEKAVERFGIKYLLPYQRLVMSNILEGRSQIVILPTGTGKSLCFQLTSLMLPGPTLIIYPLLSLISDQARQLSERGVKACILRGGQTHKERQAVWQSLESGAITMLLSNPEAVQVQGVMDHLRKFNFSHLVIDEAHCVSEWGESFRSAYLNLHRISRELAIPMITAFTATASSYVLERVKELLFPGKSVNVVQSSSDRSNIHYSFIPCLSKTHTLTQLVQSSVKPCLIFTRSRTGAEITARHLRRRLKDNNIFFFHAGLGKNEKQNIEQWFFKSKNGILTSTSAYGMGIDKPDIRTVIHHDIPPYVESYIQETGRAGRDGSPVKAIMIYSLEDFLFARRLKKEIEKRRYNQLLQAVLANRCRREVLLFLLGEEEVSCSGCDVCDGRVIDIPEGFKEIIDFISSCERVFTIKEVTQILSSLNIDSNIWESWNTDDIEEAIMIMLVSRVLHLPGNGFWKHRLCLGKENLQWMRSLTNCLESGKDRKEVSFPFFRRFRN